MGVGGGGGGALLNISKRCEKKKKYNKYNKIKMKIKTDANIYKYIIWNFRLLSMPMKAEKLILYLL